MARMRTLMLPGLLACLALAGCASTSSHTQPSITPPVSLGMIHETQQAPADVQFVALGAGDSLGRMVFMHYAIIARAQQAESEAGEMLADAEAVQAE